MPTRFDVERAVLASDLPMTRKCIMLVLAAWTDNATAAIRPENRKSLSEIAAASSAGRSTVKRDLDLLESDGWIARRRPTAEQARQGAKTGYRLLIPAEGRPPRGLGHDVAYPRPPHSPEVTSRNAEGRPPRGQGVGHHVARRSITKENHSKPSSSGNDPGRDEPGFRPDADRLCEHLADRIEGNGSLRPRITKTWRTAARLMLDKDSRSEQQAHELIDWCQDDGFWRSNIESMPTLRKQYDRLRLKAQDTTGGVINGRVLPGRTSRAIERERTSEAAARVQWLIDEGKLQI